MDKENPASAVEQHVDQFRTDAKRLTQEVGKVIVGQQRVVEEVITTLLAQGNALLEGVPGLGKTLLIRTLSNAVHLSFRRIQFTPDLMPADVVGTRTVVGADQGVPKFEFRKGPIFAHLVLADEINRATPKTQSAMLEAMQEQQVTVFGDRHSLPQPFFVLATQNPLEMEGTYPLPEAQLDRFLFKIHVPFPTLEELDTILDRTTGIETPTANHVIDGPRLLEMQDLAKRVPVPNPVKNFALRLVLATHPESEFATEKVKRYTRYGSSPRGAQAILRSAKVRALLNGRPNVAFADIRMVAPSALRHRMIVNFEGEAEGITSNDLIEEILQDTPETSREVSSIAGGTT